MVNISIKYLIDNIAFKLFQQICFSIFLFVFSSCGAIADDVNRNVTGELSDTLLSNRDENSKNESGEKWRIFVDKVLMKSNGWVMTKSHVREIKEAGFNVVSPRKGGTDLNRVRKIAKYADEIGIKYVAWMRGSLPAKDGVQYVHADGVVQPIFSPNSEEFWIWLQEVIIGHARLSLEIPSIIGTFLDFENYAVGRKGHGNLYNLSYDFKIISEFANFKGIVLPPLETYEREGWLKRNDLCEEFETYQVQLWRRKARELREKVDKINPNYLLIVYPVPKTYFITNALLPEWASTCSPLILADASTYGRRSILMPMRIALSANEKILSKNRTFVADYNKNIRYLGGINPAVTGADPEFSSLNAKMISDLVDGYWVFYEGVDYDKNHREYFDQFKQINLKLDQQYIVQ